MNIWKRIYNALWMFIGIICLGYVLDTLLFKFGFDKTLPSIYNNISGAFGGAIASIFFVKDDTKKFNIYFLIIFIILAIAVHFFVLN
ncbi:hypothetical protein ABVN58_09675 [Fusobacterium polymorphum]|uniref:Uncharacterized protein n=1 Tax=Fusobacterium nucleatum CTI-6 TaxID=1316587 RepID=U7TM72_FUSNU|nr:MULTISPECIES: hypothetical protein [Fusobacterium]ALQ43075.1 hypothetical protein RN93_09850 [Fusobacterium polymorphum]ERT45503.1 hypothetical protein HMPREF1767_02345 [Fusobacterium nucleatum CTI-6]QYR59321.1 hypothetical protein JY397_01360 [Fusobacterium polymorphum]